MAKGIQSFLNFFLYRKKKILHHLISQKFAYAYYI